MHPFLVESPAGAADGEAAIAAVAAVAPRPQVADPRVRQPRILLLDDDSFMLGVQVRMLRAMGYSKVNTAGSAEAALLMLQRRPCPVDVIVCDLNMPGMDGIQFLQILNGGTLRASVILLSGEDARIMNTVQKLFEGGRLKMLGSLQKPTTPAAFCGLLEAWQPEEQGRLPETAVAARDAGRPDRPDEEPITAAELQLANRRGQWVLHHQPKVDLRTGKVVGVEALVRWNHPRRGLLYPEAFIGAAEACGAMDALTEWVLHAAMKQLATWRDERLRIQMAVNVSMDDLCSPDFAGRIQSLLGMALASPKDITLEINEGRLMSSSRTPLENLIRLRMQGFGLSIDDFGTGHSSLAQLRDVPFTELKVDGSFVQGARHNPSIRPILEGSVGIAKRLAMRSVAEGVESEEDWLLLREIGCDLAQGYFIGAPMAAEEIPRWVADWSARSDLLVG